MTTAPTPRFTLHVVRTQRRLRELGALLRNCLATFGADDLTGAGRIIEVRDHGHVRYVVQLRAGRIVQFEAAGNRRPPDVDVAAVRDLLRREGHLEPWGHLPAGTPRPPTGTPARGDTAVSLQELAAGLLAGGPEPGWREVADAMWRAGILHRLPGPSDEHFATIVVDLARLVATGRLGPRTP